MNKQQQLREIGTQIGELCAEKNEAYGDSFAKCGEFLRLLYPNGIQPEQYGDALGLVRVFDKQMRIATHKTALGESPWRDLAGYGVLGVANDSDAGVTSLPSPPKVPEIVNPRPDLGDYFPQAAPGAPAPTETCAPKRETTSHKPDVLAPTYKVIHFLGGVEVMTEFENYTDAYIHYVRAPYKEGQNARNPGYYELIHPDGNIVEHMMIPKASK